MYTTLGFLQGVFFEVMVSLSVSMKIFEIWQYTNLADRFSIANQLLVLVILAIYVGFLTYFTFSRIPKIVAMHLISEMQTHHELIEKIESNFKSQYKREKANLVSTVRRKGKMRKLGSDLANSVIGKVRSQESELIS